MSKFPSVDGKQLLRIMSRFGFEVVRIKGSHHFLRHSDGRTTVIPVHSNETIGKGLFYKILKDCELSLEDLEDHL